MNGISVSPVVAPPPPAAGGGAGGGRGGGRGAAAPPAAGRGNVPPLYELPAGTLKAGANVVTVRITNNRNDGGFMGTPEVMFVQSGEAKAPIAGAWRYRVERQTNAGALYTMPGELGAHVAYADMPPAANATLAEPVVKAAPDVVIRLSVTPGEMKFDKTELTVAPGQLVEVVFTNPDAMQHNFLLAAPSSLQAVGAAADELAKSPSGVAQQYVPQIPQVLFFTKLVEPGETVTVQFRAPSAGRPVSVCLHVPRPLADHERHPERHAAAGAGTGRPLSMADKVRIAIVGLGFRRRVHPHLPAPSQRRDVRHLPPQRKELDACGDRFGIKTRYTSYDDLLKIPTSTRSTSTRRSPTTPRSRSPR